jgi:hypothetical protein
MFVSLVAVRIRSRFRSLAGEEPSPARVLVGNPISPLGIPM